MLNTATDSVNTYRTTLKTTPVMKAARFHGRGDIRVEEIEEPTCGKGQVKVCFTHITITMHALTDLLIDATIIRWDLWQW